MQHKEWSQSFHLLTKEQINKLTIQLSLFNQLKELLYPWGSKIITHWIDIICLPELSVVQRTSRYHKHFDFNERYISDHNEKHVIPADMCYLLHTERTHCSQQSKYQLIVLHRCTQDQFLLTANEINRGSFCQLLQRARHRTGCPSQSDCSQ